MENMDDESHLVQFQVYKASPTRVCMYTFIYEPLEIAS